MNNKEFKELFDSEEFYPEKIWVGDTFLDWDDMDENYITLNTEEIIDKFGINMGWEGYLWSQVESIEDPFIITPDMILSITGKDLRVDPAKFKDLINTFIEGLKESYKESREDEEDMRYQWYVTSLGVR